MRLRRYRASTFTRSGSGLEQVERCLRQVPISASEYGAVVVTPPLYGSTLQPSFSNLTGPDTGLMGAGPAPLVSVWGKKWNGTYCLYASVSWS
ncbi:uncharacterized [Tachysurus ichikawai]